MLLFKHQEKYAKGYPNKELVVHEGGTGKTICACVWLKDGRDKDALVVCPKRVVEKWHEALTAWGTKATVLSKEQFKKTPLKIWSALVIDEADEFASPLFGRGRSQLATTLYRLVSKSPSRPILLLTATPIRSTPWNLHTLLVFLGVYIDWKLWRARFFSLERRPFLPRPTWLPKKEWRKMIRPTLEKYSDIVLLKDCVGSLPAVKEVTIKTKPRRKLIEEPWDVNFYDKHRIEQDNKVDSILEISRSYRKVLVVAYYVEQVEQLEEELSNRRQTFAVHGKTIKQEQVLKEANESDECFLIVQASLGAGFDADSFSCVVFASMSFKARDFVQMKYRVRRIHNLHPVVYYYLIGGICDAKVKQTIELGRDFIPSEWGPTTSTPSLRPSRSEDYSSRY